MTEPSAFRFVVQGSDDQWYPLDVRQHDAHANKYFSGVWQRLGGAVDKACSLNQERVPDWVRWKPWEWCGAARPEYASRKTWVGWCGLQLVGFVNLWFDFPSPHETDRRITYIEHLAAFPGDQNTELWRRRYRHVGMALLAWSIKLSDEKGFGGRVGLHAENAVALAFYRKIARNRDLPLFFDEKCGIIGPTPHGQRNDGELAYLETTPGGAMKFLEDYRDE